MSRDFSQEYAAKSGPWAGKCLQVLFYHGAFGGNKQHSYILVKAHQLPVPAVETNQSLSFGPWIFLFARAKRAIVIINR